MQFCPTGGISLATAPGYLKLDNVASVGGSWLTPAGAIVAKDWNKITKLATGALTLRTGTNSSR